MDYVQQKMRRACSKFVEQVDSVQLMPYLPSLNQWSREMVDAKRNQEGPSAAAQVLHGLLLKKPIFEELLAALRHPSVGMNHLADLIDAPVSFSTRINAAAPDVSAGCCNTKLRPQTTETVAAVSASSAASRTQPHLGTARTCTKDLLMDESLSLEIDCPKPEKCVGYKRIEILGNENKYQNPELRPTQEPLHENIVKPSQNWIENSSPVRGETEREMNITNDEMSNDLNCSSNTDNCSLNNLHNPDDSDSGKKFSSVEQKEEDSLVQLEVRRFEDRLEKIQNTSEILKQDDMSIAHMSTNSGACANIGKSRQLCETGENQFEDYSLEVPPKIPSFTNEFNCIDRKADKPLPFLLGTTSVDNTGEFGANFQEGNNMYAEGMLSVESQNSDASHLTSDRPPDTGVKDNLHCKIDFQNRGGNTCFPRESTILERTRNVHNLDGGIKYEESGNLADQSVFSEKTNDNAIGDTGGDYAADGCDQLAAQQGACGKENKNCFNGVVDTLKSKSLRKVVRAYNSLI